MTKSVCSIWEHMHLGILTRKISEANEIYIKAVVNAELRKVHFLSVTVVWNNKKFCVLHVQSNTTIFYLVVQ